MFVKISHRSDTNVPQQNDAVSADEKAPLEHDDETLGLENPSVRDVRDDESDEKAIIEDDDFMERLVWIFGTSSDNIQLPGEWVNVIEICLENISYIFRLR